LYRETILKGKSWKNVVLKNKDHPNHHHWSTKQFKNKTLSGTIGVCGDTDTVTAIFLHPRFEQTETTAIHLLFPNRWQHFLSLVIACKAMNATLNQDQAKLAIFVLKYIHP